MIKSWLDIMKISVRSLELRESVRVGPRCLSTTWGMNVLDA